MPDKRTPQQLERDAQLQAMFAAAALTGLLANSKALPNFEVMVCTAWRYGRAMWLAQPAPDARAEDLEPPRPRPVADGTW